MKDFWTSEFTRVFDETYHRHFLAAEPGKDVPDWRAIAYREALDFCLERKLVDDIEVGLVGQFTDEFDDFERGYAFLRKQGRTKYAFKALWRTQGDVSRYYYVLREAEKVRRGVNPLGYKPEAIERQIEELRADAIKRLRFYVKIAAADGATREVQRAEAVIKQVESGALPPKPNIKPDTRPMEEATFWSLIDETNKRRGDISERCEWLAQRLTAFKPPAISKFNKILRQLMAEAYSHGLSGAYGIITGMPSDDGFEYFRAWLVLRGEKKFRAAIKKPDGIAAWISRKEEPEAEELLSVAEDAYLEVKGEELPDSAYTKDPKKLQGKPWKEEELPRLFPKLAKKFRFAVS